MKEGRLKGRTEIEAHTCYSFKGLGVTIVWYNLLHESSLEKEVCKVDVGNDNKKVQKLTHKELVEKID